MAGAQLSPTLLTIVPLAPLVGAVAAGLFGKTIGRKGAHWITCIGVAIAFDHRTRASSMAWFGHRSQPPLLSPSKSVVAASDAAV